MALFCGTGLKSDDEVIHQYTLPPSLQTAEESGTTYNCSLETKLDAFIVETRTNFEEVRAAIKFSYAELDRRVAHLESFVLDLSTRMQRLEARQTA